MARPMRGVKRCISYGFSYPGEYAPVIKALKQHAKKKGLSFSQLALIALQEWAARHRAELKRRRGEAVEAPA